MLSFFANLRIRTKLIVAFAAVLVCTAGLGLFALQRLGQINTIMVEVDKDELPSIRMLGVLSYDTTRFRQLEATLALAPDRAAQDEEAKLLNEVRVHAEQAFKDYGSLVNAGDERRMADVVSQGWRNYLALDDKFLASARQGESTAALAAVFRGDMRTEYRKLQQALDSLVEFNVGQARTSADEGTAIGQSSWLAIIGVIGVAVLICVVSGVLLVRGIAGPVMALTAAMHRLAERDMSTDIPGTGRRDEMGAMAGAVAVFKENMTKADRLAAEQETERAAKEAHAARLAELVQGFEQQVTGLVGHLSAASTELEATAQSMSSTATETNQQASTVASAAEETSTGVQTVAAAAEELTSSIEEINRQVAQSAKITEKAVIDSRETDGIVRALADDAQKIGQVVELISSIAGQTNLLALNATIEAARAGDAGKGFAVVASEVKSLANQTAKATDQISGQIAQIQSATDKAVAAIRGIGATIDDVSKITTAIASAVEEQGAATAEIARNVQQTAASTREVTSNIAGVSQAANETGVAANQVLNAAGDVSKQAESLREQVSGFLSQVQAA